MKIVIFKVVCDYESNHFQIVTDNNAFKHLNCVCSNSTEFLRKTMSISAEIRKHNMRATFIYE